MKCVQKPFWAGLALCLCVGPAAKAVPLLFFASDGNGATHDRAPFPNAAAARGTFASALRRFGHNGFEDVFGEGPLDLLFDDGTAAVLTGPGIVNFTSFSTDGGRYPTQGDQYWEAVGSTLTLTFSQPVSAVGFYATDVGDFGGQLSVRLLYVDGSAGNMMVPHPMGGGFGSPADGGVLFWGCIDTARPFQSIMLLNTAESDWYGLDDLMVATPADVTPEPQTFGLAAMGLLALWARRKWR